MSEVENQSFLGGETNRKLRYTRDTVRGFQVSGNQ